MPIDELISSRRRGITLRAVASVSSSSALAVGEPQASPLFDRLAVAVLVAMAGVALMTFRDYGLGWDDYTHSEYGDLLLALYGSGFADTRALSFVNLYMYGGGFDMAAALAAKVLPFTLFETRRLVGALVGLIGLIVTWRTGRRIGGPLAGLIALVLLATCPLYYGHMFMNPKDAPFAAAMAILLLGLVRALEAYPRITPATGALTGPVLACRSDRGSWGIRRRRARRRARLGGGPRSAPGRPAARPRRGSGASSWRCCPPSCWPMRSWRWCGPGP